MRAITFSHRVRLVLIAFFPLVNDDPKHVSVTEKQKNKEILFHSTVNKTVAQKNVSQKPQCNMHNISQCCVTTWFTPMMENLILFLPYRRSQCTDMEGTVEADGASLGLMDLRGPEMTNWRGKSKTKFWSVKTFFSDHCFLVRYWII